MNKELTALEIVKRWKTQIFWKQDWGWEKELSIVEKSLKVLEIIKTKNIDAEDVKIFNTYSSFNQRRSLRGLGGIKKDEYELLKEMLKDE